MTFPAAWNSRYSKPETGSMVDDPRRTMSDHSRVHDSNRQEFAKTAYKIRSRLLELARRVVDEPSTEQRVVRHYQKWYPKLEGATAFFLAVSGKENPTQQAHAACEARALQDPASEQAYELFRELVAVRSRTQDETGQYAEALKVLESCQPPRA